MICERSIKKGLTDKDIQKESIKATEMNGKLMKIRTVGDQKVCPKCAEW